MGVWLSISSFLPLKAEPVCHSQVQLNRRGRTFARIRRQSYNLGVLGRAFR
jgi:hypothetical protein